MHALSSVRSSWPCRRLQQSTMAIYHFHASFVTRSTGRSPVAAAAYQSRDKLFDERQGITHNYIRENEEVHHEILAQDGAPEWVLQRAELWNRVDTFEDHVARMRFRSQEGQDRYMDSAQTAQSVRGALPIELNPEQNKELVESFLKDRFVERGLVVDYAIHWDSGNPHFHALVTRRPLEEGRFSYLKDREIASKAALQETRSLWSERQNEFLERAGQSIRVDHRSHADRGIVFEPLQHEGPHAHRLSRAGLFSRIAEENQQTRERNVDIAIRSPEALLHELTERQATFSEVDLAKSIFDRVEGNPESFEVARSHVLHSPELVSIGSDIEGNTRYTTRTYLHTEKDLFHTANALQTWTPERVQQPAIRTAIAGTSFPLTEEQKGAVRQLTQPGDLGVLVGRAGTGKTITLRTVVDAYRRSGARVRGAALSGIAAEKLAEETGIQTRTLHSWEHLWSRAETVSPRPHEGISKLTPRDVFIVDEAGMVGTNQLARILREAKKTGSKILLIGDPKQIQPIEAGTPFRRMADAHDVALLTEVHRQDQSWQKTASSAFADGRTGDALRAYDRHERIVWSDSRDETLQHLAQDYVRDMSSNPGQSALILAHERADVRRLNELVRSHRQERGELGSGLVWDGDEFQVGDRIVFQKNDNQRQVPTFGQDQKPSSTRIRNGTLGAIESVSGPSRLQIRLDNGDRAHVNLETYASIAPGYAVTIHKAQGTTVDQTYVFASPHMRQDTLYPAMTRHRSNATLYADRKSFRNLDGLARRLGRPPGKDLVSDYSIPASRRDSWQRVKDYKLVSTRVARLFGNIQDRLPPDGDIRHDPEWETFKTLQSIRNRLAKEVVLNSASHQDFLRQSNLSIETVERHAGRLSRPLTLEEQTAETRIRLYVKLRDEARNVWNQIKRTHPGASSRSHPEFSWFDALRSKRNKTAMEIMSDTQLHQRLVRNRSASWQTLARQADQHIFREDEERRRERLWEDERFLEETEERAHPSKARDPIRRLPTHDVKGISTGRGDPVQAFQSTTELLRRASKESLNSDERNSLKLRWNIQAKEIHRSERTRARLQQRDPKLNRAAAYAIERLRERGRARGRER